MAQIEISILTFTKFLTSIFIVTQIIPVSIAQEALPEFETKLRSLSQHTPLDLQAPAETALPLRYRFVAPAKYNNDPQPQPIQIHRRAPHEHNLNLHYRKLEDDEVPNHQYLKAVDQDSLSRLYRKPQEQENPMNPIRQYQKPAEDPNNINGAQYQKQEGEPNPATRLYRKPQEQENPIRQYQKPAEDPNNLNGAQYQKQEGEPNPANRLYRKPQEQENPINPIRQYQKPAEDPNNINGAQYQKQEVELNLANRQYRKPQDETEAPPVTTPTPSELPKEPLPVSESLSVSEKQLKAQKVELLKLIDQVGFDKAVHIFENRIKSEFNPKGPTPTNQQSKDVRNKVLKNITTYHIYQPDRPLSEITEPTTTTTTLKPQFPDNVESPIEGEYTGQDDLKSSQDEQQEARQNRDENGEGHQALGQAPEPKNVPNTSPSKNHPNAKPHQAELPSKTHLTTARPVSPKFTTKHTTKKPAPKITKKTTTTTTTTTTTSTTTTTTTPAPTHSRRGTCPSFSEFRVGAVILWESLKRVNNVFGGVHLIVEAVVEAIKALGICFFSIGTEVMDAINDFFTVENDPSENDPERNFLNSTRF